ncbi:FAD-binding oxidoreductase [Luteolibacter flavescens]|uniref:FAD-binding oxidoreductase n=1 Tax=Luteolibacter flavescens TaxID=1859460 RepID=A0ABT3FUV5_9BACT|nr:FAD-binding oxidoreductase [Luteolibacter flavescens]MCW1887340.1 FAD-binding oxidoreductase [Luteolibacter flavescens]
MTDPLLCNDVHSQLNPVRVAQIHRPRSTSEVAALIREAARDGRPVSICGARHAMGGQQFGDGTMLLDCSDMKEIGGLDRERGIVEAGAGLTWPELIAALHDEQTGESPVWTIRQKQTGADDLTLGGALASNIHGRGLRMKPFIDDVEAFTLVDASGEVRRCSRTEHADLFRLVIGGYGCFGVVTSVALRLAPRIKVARRVEVTTLDQLHGKMEERMEAGALYGDFQFAIDECSQDFLNRGVLSTYQPVPQDRKMEEVRTLGADEWRELIRLAHTDRTRAFETYAKHYLGTDGSLYWSDTHQLAVYLCDYHHDLDCCLGSGAGTEMITELYVPPQALTDFMKAAAGDLRPRGVPVIYGTIRWIRRDEESHLPWAREDFACVIFNLHVEHDRREPAVEAFRALIDLALSFGGCYFLTYHRWARRDQVEKAYPGFAEFLAEKERRDPEGRFQSEWWRCYREMFSGCGDE